MLCYSWEVKHGALPFISLVCLGLGVFLVLFVFLKGNVYLEWCFLVYPSIPPLNNFWDCWAIWNSSWKMSKRKQYPCTSSWKSVGEQWVETQLGIFTDGKADKIHLLVIQFGLRKAKNANPGEIKIHWFCCSHSNLENPNFAILGDT